MTYENHQRLQADALGRQEVSRQGKPKARRGRSRQRPPGEHGGGRETQANNRKEGTR